MLDIRSLESISIRTGETLLIKLNKPFLRDLFLDILEESVSLQSLGGQSGVCLLSVRQSHVVVDGLSHLLLLEPLQLPGLLLAGLLSPLKVVL